MNIGFDIDGVITSQPEYFSLVTKALRKGGHTVHIVTSRSPTSEVQEITKKELKGYKVDYDFIYFLPELEDRNSDEFPKELDWFQKRIWQKAEYCNKYKINIFYEDCIKTVKLIRTYSDTSCVQLL
jgi:hypothetical protein